RSMLFILEASRWLRRLGRKSKLILDDRSARLEKRADILCEEFRLLQRCEVAAARHVRPLRDTEEALDPFERRNDKLLRKTGEAERRLDPFGLFELQRTFSGLAIESHR